MQYRTPSTRYTLKFLSKNISGFHISSRFYKEYYYKYNRKWQKIALKICKLIISNVADKNPEDNNGDTPLHLAAKNQYHGYDLCRIIIYNNFKDNVYNKNLKNNDGKTPLDVAVTAQIRNLLTVCFEKEAELEVKSFLFLWLFAFFAFVLSQLSLLGVD